MTLRHIRRALPALALAGITLAGIAATPKQSHDAAVSRNLNIFNSLIKELEANYVDSVKTDEVFNVAIGSLLEAIDPYTEYFSADDRDNLSKLTTGEYGGIGSYIMQRDSFVYLSGPFENSPAAQAGLRAGDRLLRIDTTDVKNVASDKVSKLLRGVPGTKVAIDVWRPYVADSLLHFEVERRKVVSPSIDYWRLDPATGNAYISLNSYIDKTPREMEKVLDSLRTMPGLKSITLDLRGNGGGLVESAVEVLGMFLPKGTEVLRTRGRDARKDKIYRTTRKPIFPVLPLAVLIDGGTASSAEITAGALQDLDRAVLIGTRSYGKGLVQGTRPLPYDGTLKVTVAKYYIPSGRLIQAYDFSRRNPDGSVARTPDSLTNVFTTRAGREVRDGGGLKPDIEVEWEKPTRLLYNIARDNWAFDFANRYYATHPSIAPAEEFVITDEIYSDFKKSIDPARFKYDKVGENLIKDLNELLTTEGYLTDSVKACIDTLSNLLVHDLDSDLDSKRPSISRYLAAEIASRYYYERGRKAQELRGDPAQERALEILADPAEYRKLLSPKKK